MKLIWKKLVPELLAHKSRLFWIFILGVFVSALKAMTPELLNRLVNDAWGQSSTGGTLGKFDEHLAVVYPIIMALIWTLSGIGRYFHVYWIKYTADVVAIKLRKDLMDKYLALDLSFFQKFVRGSGGLISRMIMDISVIQDGIHKFADVVREPFMVMFAFAYLIYIDWKLTIFVLISAPLITGVLRSLARSLRKYGHMRQESLEDLTKTLKESLDGTRVVQSFNLEEEMRRRFAVQSEEYLKSCRKILSREEAAGPVSESLAALTLAALLIYFGQQILQSRLTIGDFTGFTFAIGLLQDAIKKLQNGYIKLQQASVALERIHDVMASTPKVSEIAQPVPFPQDWSTIDFKNVSFRYDDRDVLKNVNLTVKRGELLALVGSSGSGKSTLVNLLERFFDPVEGEIFVGGVNIKNLSLESLRKNIALVSQDVFLFSDSIEKNIALGNPDRPVSEILQSAQQANAHEFILQTPEGYATRAGDRGAHLSGGEKQRVSIARALFKNAPILILDEATSALDAESELEVQKGIDSLLVGRTAFVIAHRLATVKHADRIIVMKNGEIVEEGTHLSLADKRGEYAKFLSLQHF